MQAADLRSPQEAQASLASTLTYEPRELGFGTSGRRGRVVDLTQMEIYICATGELEYLQSLPAEKGGIAKDDPFYYACDLRPSSTSLAAEEAGCGEIAQAIERAIVDAGMKPVNCGCIPTPALAYYALTQGKGSIMITGSHIPFDRNGYKTNTSIGELLKEQETPIGEFVKRVRERVYGAPASESLFNHRGMFKTGHVELSAADPAARESYVQRYLDFFGGSSLQGMRVIAYQHSAVGRDMLVDILSGLGAEVFPTGRSDEFIPIDTENIDAARLAAIQTLADEVMAQHGPMDAVVSTDGDSDRPLLLGIEPDTKKVRFFGGDLLGMVVAEYLGADAVVVPISCNDGIDRGSLAGVLETKTRIGSPFVIAGMEAAKGRGKTCVCGWEANGGFLTGCDITKDGHTLRALPTRDAMLPLLACLFSAREKGLGLCDLFARLPERFSRAGLLKQFPRPVALEIVRRFSASAPGVLQVSFAQDALVVLGTDGAHLDSPEIAAELQGVRERLAGFFRTEDGFGSISAINYVDGVRIIFENGEVAHLRPSGNADELRIYAVADTVQRSEEIVARGLAEPNGILRSLEKFVSDN